MKKFELIDGVAQVTGLAKCLVREVLDAAAGVAKVAVASGEDVFLFGLGKLEVRQRREKQARNLHTGTPVTVPPRKAVVFKPSDSLIIAANG